MELRVINLYPDQMNIYADRGNILFLGMRCKWREIDFLVRGCGIGDTFEPAECDLLYIGGGQDRDQELVARDLLDSKREAMEATFSAGKVILAVCGGYQLLGGEWETGTGIHEGLGLVDVRTIRSDEARLTGPVLIETDFGGEPMSVAGFENHGGRTYLGGQTTPFGRVLSGHGNNDEDEFEGVMEGNLIGTYLHGPLLPKNYLLADRLIETALGSRYGERPELPKLDDRAELEAHEAAVQAALSAR